MPTAIFVFHKDASGYLNDKFSNVASVQQLDFLPDSPEGVVASEDGSYITPYYRQEEVTLNCYSEEHRQEVWENIQDDTAALVKNYRLSIELLPVDTIDIM